MALGFTDVEPLPLYFDYPWEIYDSSYDRDNFRTRRGGYFWKAMMHLRDVMKDHILAAFPDDAAVLSTLDRIHAMLEAESDLVDSDEGLPALTHPTVSIQREQYELAIQIFNTPLPFHDLQSVLGPVLIPTMGGAIRGVQKAFKYMKNPGRELNTLIPGSLRDASDIYLTSCGSPAASTMKKK